MILQFYHRLDNLKTIVKNIWPCEDTKSLPWTQIKNHIAQRVLVSKNSRVFLFSRNVYSERNLFFNFLGLKLWFPRKILCSGTLNIILSGWGSDRDFDYLTPQ